jgi:hypothetical protein
VSKVLKCFRAALLLPLLAQLSACGDDPGPGPINDLWEQATLVDPPSRGEFFSLASSGSKTYAAGVGFGGPEPQSVRSPYLVARSGDDTWAPPAGVPLPANSLLTSIGFSPAGEALVAGISVEAQTGFILDERAGWSRHDFPFGGRAFAAAASVLRFAGSAAGNNAIMESSAPDIWTPESLPFPGQPGEHAITDITARADVLFACGFDDGGDGTPSSPNSVVFRSDGEGWVRIEAPCGGCSNREFKAVAATPDGGLLLGGAITNFSAGSADPYQAFLYHYSDSDGWEEIPLADPGRLDRVNDILITSQGDIFLACGQGRAFIVRLLQDGSSELEATLPTARIAMLAESHDGIVAAGAIFSPGGAENHPAIWIRRE